MRLLRWFPKADANSETNLVLSLPQSGISFLSRFKFGFTIIETLIVILVIGILSATGVSMYAGATNDSLMASLNDRLFSFFKACHHRVILRKTPVKLVFYNNILGIEQSSSLKLRITELATSSKKLLNGLKIEKDRFITSEGKVLPELNLKVLLPGNKLQTVTIGKHL
ncbi:MAG: pilus assembly FimT family protein [Candidatus Rifleibacteriota bacterium]